MLGTMIGVWRERSINVMYFDDDVALNLLRCRADILGTTDVFRSASSLHGGKGEATGRVHFVIVMYWVVRLVYAGAFL